MNKKTKLLFVALGLVTTLNAMPSDTYVIINGEAISKSEIEMSAYNQKIDFNTLTKDQKKLLVNKIVDQKLLEQYAIKSGIQKDPMYLETLEKVKKTIALQTFLSKSTDALKITKQDILDFYNKNSKYFVKPQELKAKHILVKTKEEASKIIKELKNSKSVATLFSKLAKEKSTGPSSKDGGELGWFSVDKMVPSFGNATANLNVGNFTLEPVKTKFGFHVIYLEDKKEKITAKLAEVEEQITQQLKKEKLLTKINTLIESTKKNGKIEYNKSI